MRFVDEFRDADKAHALSAKITALCEPGRQYKLMEVCGGHTHTIYKHGLEDYLPEQITLVHGPGCPVCVIPMGRVDDAMALAAEPDVIMTSFGDMMRVPGSNGSFFDAKAKGTDIRMVYSPLDSLKIARKNPDKRVVFMAIGFETTAPSTAMTVLRAAAEGLDNFSIFCNHVTIVPAIKAILDSPDLRLDGFLGPGHVSTVIGCRPYEFIARDYGKPVVVAGFEPLDILQSIYMLMLQLSRGESTVENQYSRVVPWNGNTVALKAIGQTMELRPYFEWRGLGFISHSALKVRRAVRQVRRRAAVLGARRAGRRPEGVPVRRGPQGRAQTLGVQGLRDRVHPGDADRHLHGVARGRVRRLLQLRPPDPARVKEASHVMTADQQNAGMGGRRPQRARGAGRARRRPAAPATGPRSRCRAPSARNWCWNASTGPAAAARGSRKSGSRCRTGPGGKATQTLIEAIFLDEFRNPLLEPLEDAARLQLRRGAAGPHDRFLRRVAAVLPRRRASATWPSTARSTTWRCPEPPRCTCRPASSWRKDSRSPT